MLPAGVYKDAACTELILEDVVAEGSSTNEMSIAFGNQTYGPSYDPSWQPRHWGFVDYGKPGGEGKVCLAAAKAMAEAAVNLGIFPRMNDPITGAETHSGCGTVTLNECIPNREVLPVNDTEDWSTCYYNKGKPVGTCPPNANYKMIKAIGALARSRVPL